jgi:hypothetical protein
MDSSKVCRFCVKKGIPLPHNHTVRNWKLAGKPIICPELLANICTSCSQAGHTRQYCPLRLTNTLDVSVTGNNLKRPPTDYEWTINKVQKTE